MKHSILILASFFSVGIAFSQINPSDDYHGIPDLPVHTSESFNRFKLFGEFDDKGLAISSAAIGKDRDDGWFRIIATSNVTKVIASGDHSFSVAVYENFADQEIKSLHNPLKTRAEMTFKSEIGEDYYLQIHRQEGGNNTSMTGQISVITKNAPENDTPQGAYYLPVTSFEMYSVFSNEYASTDEDYPTAECAMNSGSDVWFHTTVPLSGSITFEANVGEIVDGGMAVYSGTADNLKLIQCDDDSSENGLMPKLELRNLEPGDKIFIRFWDYGDNVSGTFGICAVNTKGTSLAQK